MAVLVLLILGFLDATYLLIIKLTNIQALCLEGVGDCWSVNTSKYSEIMGIPISVFGMVAYLLLFLLQLVEGKGKSEYRYSILGQFGISFCGFMFSIYLTYIQFIVLEKVCPFCLVSATIMTTIFILTTIRLVKAQATI
jgi:uncharacterized membrane protein